MTIPYFCTFFMKEWIKDKRILEEQNEQTT